MGLFDSVWVSCPACGAPVEFQSKGSDDAYLRSFTPENAPKDVMLDAEGAHRCGCGQWVALEVNQTIVWKTYPIEEPSGAHKHATDDIWFAPFDFDIRRAVRSVFETSDCGSKSG